MAKMFVVIQTGHPHELAKALLGQMPSSTLPAGVKQIHTTAWIIELPKCTEFFTTLLNNVKRVNRVCVVSEIAPGTDPLVLSEIHH